MAYETSSKRTITLDYIRMRSLAEIDRRGFTAADIEMVVRYVRNRIAKQPKTHGMKHGFSDASIGFQNLMLDVNKFEDRVLEAREVLLNSRVKGEKIVRTTIRAGDVRSLVETAEVIDPSPIRTALAGALAELSREIGGA